MSGSSTAALLAAGQAALREGRFVEALESYERVLDDHRPDVWPGCGDACEAALRGLVVVGDAVEVRPERVRRFLAAALPHASTSSRIFLDAARVYLRLGEVDQVLSMLWNGRAHNAHREVAAVLDEPAFAAVMLDAGFRELVEDLPGASAGGGATGSRSSSSTARRSSRLRCRVRPGRRPMSTSSPTPPAATSASSAGPAGRPTGWRSATTATCF